MSNRRRPQATIPQPVAEVRSLYVAALATKELVETLAGQRGTAYDAAVTWEDLMRLGLITRDQIPRDIGSHPLQPTGPR